MNILGLDALVFGVDNLPACRQYLRDYGLRDAGGDRYEALDGTAVVLRAHDDPALPPGLGTTSFLRETVYGVADAATLEAIATELSRDRTVHRGADGAVSVRDDTGFALRFQRTQRRMLQMAAECVNAPGAPVARPANALGVDDALEAVPRTLSHVVYFVPDSIKAEAFYHRLGFVCTDRFTGVGPFLRPAGTLEHHTLFMIQTPSHMTGCEHFTFHMGGPTEVMLAGTRFVEKGYPSFWGPGRHKYGSNWFWYFKSPLRCNVEYDADMDLHDDAWTAREAPMGADSSQAFLLTYREKWAPGGAPANRGPEVASPATQSGGTGS